MSAIQIPEHIPIPDAVTPIKMARYWGAEGDGTLHPLVMNAVSLQWPAYNEWGDPAKPAIAFRPPGFWGFPTYGRAYRRANVFFSLCIEYGLTPVLGVADGWGHVEVATDGYRVTRAKPVAVVHRWRGDTAVEKRVAKRYNVPLIQGRLGRPRLTPLREVLNGHR